jgi:tetratricopeptide (TPR) repeat protein
MAASIRAGDPEDAVRRARAEEKARVRERRRRLPGPRRWLLFALLVTACAHVPALRAGYVYDDVEAILENPDLADLRALPRLFRVHYWGEHPNIGLYRPLVQASYLLDGAVLGWSAPLSHALQTLFHLLVVAALFGFLVRLGLHATAAGLGASLFGIHPALLDASVWISGRTDVLAALFVLLGLRAALRAADREEGLAGPWTFLLGLLFLTGLLSKEVAVALPLLVLALPGCGHWRRLPALALALGAYLLLRREAVPGLTPLGQGEGGVLFLGRTTFEAILLGARAVVRLLGFLVWPVGLAGDHTAHPWVQRDAPVDARCAGALMVLLAMAGGALLARRRAPIQAFLGLGVVIAFVPVLQIIPIGAAMAERFLFLPAAFALPILAHAIWAHLRPAAGYLAASALILLLGTLTVRRIPIYEDRGSFCRAVLAVYPEDHRAWNNLGVYHLLPLEGQETHAADPLAAADCFRQALRVRPGYRRGRLMLARALLVAHARDGDPDHLAAIDEVLGVPAAREDPEALLILGQAALRRAEAATGEALRGAAGQALERFEAAARGFAEQGKRRREAAAWKEAGRSRERLGEGAEAARAYERCLELDPGHPETAMLRARIARLRGGAPLDGR